MHKWRRGISEEQAIDSSYKSWNREDKGLQCEQCATAVEGTETVEPILGIIDHGTTGLMNFTMEFAYFVSNSSEFNTDKICIN